MLLLYPANNGASNEDKILYIPLCFYYIGEQEVIKAVNSLPLHSTMLLLYPVAADRLPENVPLYIPLCFYYITYPYTYAIIDDNYFTFHYASTISTIPVSAFPVPLAALHSTMLLLYPRENDEITNIMNFTFHYASTISK